ncbi:rRNA maturation RNase YbeY [bacterium]|jgi:probable rRNA maturation factor|nr:rRNA maturation RNase YbeY [bacterium]MDP6571263.1 rRNA maturation RNase YbeY [Patescibacteria group bacterium]MDP6756267.1 rRNA maturation RNase YbeY [Patescibacteria group bacterium]|tara:strand:+ start:1821 stop:2228 length:408 start_codon:yes stop_codon:yes gene_type:complete
MQINFINQASNTARIPRVVILRAFKRAQKLFSRKIGNKSIGVVFVGRSESKNLNAKYRGKNRATNVLSFELKEKNELGDIIICPSIARQEALNLNIGFNEHIVYLFSHGLLHLLGYDHKTNKEDKKMEKLIQKII